MTPLGWLRPGPWQPLIVAAVLRVICAASGVGFLFSDDYDSVIAPAGEWLVDPDAQALWEIRSVFFPRLFWCLMRLGTELGIRDPGSLLHWCYLWLGAWSLLGVLGVYKLAAQYFAPTSATIAGWLMAAHPLMPLVSTRALIEVVCIPPLVWGFVCLKPRSMTHATTAGVLLGVAAMFRFQVGILYLIAFAVIARQDLPNHAYRRLIGLTIGGLLAATAQAAVDIAGYGTPFASLYAYLELNVSSAAELFGRTGGPLTYVAFFALITVPPAILLLLGALWHAASRAPLVSLSLAGFLIVHSLLPHREERFMFSVVPLFFVLLGQALYVAYFRLGWSRRAVMFFCAVCGLALPLVTTFDPQQSSTAPLLEVARASQPPDLTVWVGRREPPSYYLGKRSPLLWTEDGLTPDARRNYRPYLPERFEFRDSIDPSVDRIRVIFMKPPAQETLAWLRGSRFSCDGPREYPNGLLDNLVYRLNPKRNQRRAPTQVLNCTRGGEV